MVADIKDVINGLECCTYLGCHHGCVYLNNGCRPLLEKDALELLKEQRAEIARLKAEIPVHCKVCNFMKNGADPDCMVCGNPKSRRYEHEVNENDYCAEGKEG